MKETKEYFEYIYIYIYYFFINVEWKIKNSGNVRFGILII